MERKQTGFVAQAIPHFVLKPRLQALLTLGLAIRAYSLSGDW